MKPRIKKLTLRLDASTWRWIRALARACANADIPASQNGGKVTAEELLEQAAFCMADCAGKRTGSWEADVARTMLCSSGFAEDATDADADRCRKLDQKENEQHFAWWGSLTPEQKADEHKMTGKQREDFLAFCRKTP